MAHHMIGQSAVCNILNSSPFRFGNLKLDVWTNNQWKENSIIYRIPKAYCSTVRSNFPGLYETFYQASAWSKGLCTFLKKTYTMDNTPINWTLPNFPLLPYGRYKCTSTVWSPKKVKEACFVFELIIVPRL
ncbi:uncharacterized protein LOC127749684 [Frankliniella occidentalis]|uniref:Uncharacterized protein LOC127749684 n=1 Tax=Frankliniella occidentalis TaxID=133901 RepID=A0A9C6WYU5_FRAOC|nr:uncharacterized protein LOC127749684 [Frankliniella occidentalis]